MNGHLEIEIEVELGMSILTDKIIRRCKISEIRSIEVNTKTGTKTHTATNIKTSIKPVMKNMYRDNYRGDSFDRG